MAKHFLFLFIRKGEKYLDCSQQTPGFHYVHTCMAVAGLLELGHKSVCFKEGSSLSEDAWHLAGAVNTPSQSRLKGGSV